MSKLSEVDNKIKYEQDKLDEMKDGTQYTDEMRDRVSKRIEDLKEERKTRLEIATQNQKEMQSQIARIRQTIDKSA